MGIRKALCVLDSNQYFAFSFSNADVTDTSGRWGVLNKCNCKLNGDTVYIWIYSNLAEGGLAISISLTNDFWESFIQHYSDIEEFESGYFQNYAPEKSTLFINLPNYKTGDILVGSIDITAKDIRTMKLDQLKFKGKFQCVIQKNQ